MPVLIPAPGTPANQTQALTITRDVALAQFKAAFDKVNDPPPAEDPKAKAEDREKARALLAEYEKAKREMAAALKLIGEADRQAGKAQIQMTTTAVCKRIEYLMGSETGAVSSTTANQEIDSLAGVLTALATLLSASSSAEANGASAA